MVRSLLVAIFLLAAAGARAAPWSWNGAAGTGKWGDGGNWAGGVAPPDDGSAAITIAASGIIALDATRVISSLAVSAAADVTLQAGAQAQSVLVLRGAGLSRSARGRLILQVPVLSGGTVAFSGFEAQTALATATTFDLLSGGWSGGTTVSQAMVTASGDAVPSSSRLT